MPLKLAKALQAALVQPSALARVAAKNQKWADPTQTDWNPVFHLAEPIAEMTTPRRAAAWRNSVMKISRPITITTIHHGSPIGPNGVANCNRAASMLSARVGTRGSLGGAIRTNIGISVANSSSLSASGSRGVPRAVMGFRVGA